VTIQFIQHRRQGDAVTDMPGCELYQDLLARAHSFTRLAWANLAGQYLSFIGREYQPTDMPTWGDEESEKCRPFLSGSISSCYYNYYTTIQGPIL
jgi:hypothetical protein